MSKSISDLLMLAGTGANITIDASQKSTSDLIMLVGAIGRKNAHITLINCSSKSTSDLLMLCRIYPKNITLDFSPIK